MPLPGRCLTHEHIRERSRAQDDESQTKPTNVTGPQAAGTVRSGRGSPEDSDLTPVNLVRSSASAAPGASSSGAASARAPRSTPATSSAAAAPFPRDEEGRGHLVLGRDAVVPLVYRHTLVSSYFSSRPDGSDRHRGGVRRGGARHPFLEGWSLGIHALSPSLDSPGSRTAPF